MAGALLEGQHVGQSVAHTQVGVADHKAGLVVFHLADHLGLLVNGLGDIDEGDAALAGQANAHLLTGDGLHDGGDHGDVHGQGGGLSLAELHHRRLQRDVGGNAFGGRITGDQQILTEGTGRLFEKVGHGKNLISLDLWDRTPMRHRSSRR